MQLSRKTPLKLSLCPFCHGVPGSMHRAPIRFSYNTALGDILVEPNTMQRFLEASQIGASALEELGARGHVAARPIGPARGRERSVSAALWTAC